MAEFFEIISDEDRAESILIFDSMLDKRTFGKTCKLIYSVTEQICPNCIINPKNGESTNKYKSGGPIEFIDGEICPVCYGTGRVSCTEQTEDIVMVIDWNPKPWVNVGMDGNKTLRVPDGSVMTRGFSSDLIKIKNCDYVVLDSENISLIENKYKLSREPYILGPITNNRYFIGFWDKV